MNTAQLDTPSISLEAKFEQSFRELNPGTVEDLLPVSLFEEPNEDLNRKVQERQHAIQEMFKVFKTDPDVLEKLYAEIDTIGYYLFDQLGSPSDYRYQNLQGSVNQNQGIEIIRSLMDENALPFTGKLSDYNKINDLKALLHLPHFDIPESGSPAKLMSVIWSLAGSNHIEKSDFFSAEDYYYIFKSFYHYRHDIGDDFDLNGRTSNIGKNLFSIFHILNTYVSTRNDLLATVLDSELKREDFRRIFEGRFPKLCNISKAFEVGLVNHISESAESKKIEWSEIAKFAFARNILLNSHIYPEFRRRLLA